MDAIGHGSDHELVVDCAEVTNYRSRKGHNHGNFHGLVMVGVETSLLSFRHLLSKSNKNHGHGGFHSLTVVHYEAFVRVSDAIHDCGWGH